MKCEKHININSARVQEEEKENEPEKYLKVEWRIFQYWQNTMPKIQNHYEG